MREIDPDAYEIRREDETESFFLVQAARAVLVGYETLSPGARAVVLLSSRSFSFAEAWQAVDLIDQEEEKRKWSLH